MHVERSARKIAISEQVEITFPIEKLPELEYSTIVQNSRIYEPYSVTSVVVVWSWDVKRAAWWSSVRVRGHATRSRKTSAGPGRLLQVGSMRDGRLPGWLSALVQGTTPDDFLTLRSIPVESAPAAPTPPPADLATRLQVGDRAVIINLASLSAPATRLGSAAAEGQPGASLALRGMAQGIAR